MIYWIKEKRLGFESWQVENALKEGRLKEDEYILVDEDEWRAVRAEAVEKFCEITVDEAGHPHAIEVEPDALDLLRLERDAIDQWLRDHDYIGTKIATGRATKEEYADIIAEMDRKATRKNEINAILQEGDR